MFILKTSLVMQLPKTVFNLSFIFVIVCHFFRSFHRDWERKSEDFILNHSSNKAFLCCTCSQLYTHSHTHAHEQEHMTPTHGHARHRGTPTHAYNHGHEIYRHAHGHPAALVIKKKRREKNRHTPLETRAPLLVRDCKLGPHLRAQRAATELYTACLP